MDQPTQVAVVARGAMSQPTDHRASGMTSPPSLQLLDPKRDAVMVGLFSRFVSIWKWFGHDWDSDAQRAVARAEWAKELRGSTWVAREAAIEQAKRLYPTGQPPSPQQFGQLCRAEQARREETADRMRGHYSIDEIAARSGLEVRDLEQRFADRPLALPEPKEAARARRLRAQSGFRQALADAFAGREDSPILSRLKAKRAAVSADSATN